MLPPEVRLDFPRGLFGAARRVDHLLLPEFGDLLPLLLEALRDFRLELVEGFNRGSCTTLTAPPGVRFARKRYPKICSSLRAKSMQKVILLI